MSTPIPVGHGRTYHLYLPARLILVGSDGYGLVYPAECSCGASEPGADHACSCELGDVVYAPHDWHAEAAPTWQFDSDGDLRELTSSGTLGRVVEHRAPRTGRERRHAARAFARDHHGRWDTMRAR